MQKNYYAIIPANVRYDQELSPNAKLLYGEITALCNERGYCWASNSYFSELYKVSKVSISKWVNQLVSKGYLTSDLQYKDGTKEILNRYLRIVNDPIKENLDTPIKEKFKDNITSINTTSNNTKELYIQYAEFVKMKESEYNKLVEEHGEPLTKKMIEVLDNYKGANGKKYKSDYRAILNWVADKVKGVKNERFKQGGRKPNTSEYDSLSL
jgi:transposase